MNSLPDIERFGADAPLLTASELEACLVHENADVLVFNKPGWLVCHPSKNGPWSSLVGAIGEHYGLERLHLVARLDRETSGVVILAKHRKSASRLQKAIQERWVDKRYLCILEGDLTERREVSQPIGPDEASPVAVKQQVMERFGGQKAQTTFKPLQHGGGFTLAEARPHTGRKHQIRVHARHLGHPVVGDKLYGPDERLYLDFTEQGWTPRHAELLPHPRQCLHCAEMRFASPDFEVTYTAPLPHDMQRFLRERMGVEAV